MENNKTHLRNHKKKKTKPQKMDEKTIKQTETKPQKMDEKTIKLIALSLH